MILSKKQKEEDARMWADAMASLDKFHNECDRINFRIMKAITNQLGNAFVKNLCIISTDCEVSNDAWWFSKTPIGSYQKEGYGAIKGYWVSQQSVGDSGDSYSGTICIKLKERLYLIMPFSM